MSSKTRSTKSASILLIAGAAAIVSAQAQAVPTPQSCPSSGNSKAPFYGVSAAQIGHGKELHVAGNYRLKERNQKLTLTKSGGNSEMLKLRLRSNRSVGSSAGCPHFGGAFKASTSVKKVRITDWNGKQITVRVGRPSKNVSAERSKTP